MDVAWGEARDPGRGRIVAPAGAIIIGLAVLVAGALVARDGTVPGVEESIFRAVNDLPGALYPLAWPLQLFGTLVAGPAVAVVAVILRRYRLAVAAVAVTALKLATERGVKAIVSRERPGTSIGPDVELRGDVSLAGPSWLLG